MELYYAHVRDDGEKQSVSAHCRNVACFAKGYLSSCHLDQVGYLTGLLHDMGKCKAEFQRYLFSGSGRKGSVIHTFTPVRFLLDTFWTDEPDMIRALTAELIAFSDGAHHGLFDIENGKKENGYIHRSDALIDMGYSESCEGFFSSCADWEEISAIFDSAVVQIKDVISNLLSMTSSEETETEDVRLSFCCGLLARLLLSAVIDGDRSDTAAFMTKQSAFHSNEMDWGAVLSRVEEKLDQFPCKTPIDQARRKISDICREFAEEPGGIIRLNVPTGGGKTLSSLRYALAHAKKCGKDRIIFTAPLLTILEQNAAVIRSYIGDDGLILEHHSNVVDDSAEKEFFDMHEAMQDNWDAPIVITTMVQLFNTMFSGKTSCIRRFHSLVNSIIVIDEVQTVPVKLLTMFNLTVDFLANICGATVILCSATQPEYGTLKYALTGPAREMVPYDKRLWDVFRRTVLKYGGKMTIKEIPDFARNILMKADSLLIVCNTKKEAAFLFRELQDDTDGCYHLSASMCPEHRRATLVAVNESLKRGGKTVCVSTQVIEAGVDISFGAVIRLCAGLDSIVQSAGRCNRNGESTLPLPVYIVTVLDENLSMLREIERCKDASVSLIEAFQRSPKDFSGDIASVEANLYYYRRLYSALPLGETDYPCSSGTLLELLSTNRRFCREDSPYILNQAFKTAGELFSVFEEDTTDVLVPYGRGKDIIIELQNEDSLYDFAHQKALLKEAHAYAVPMYRHQLERMESTGGVYRACGGAVAVLTGGFYSEKIGFSIEENDSGFLEV